MNYKITWKEADPESGNLTRKTETIEADTQKEALTFVECYRYWVTEPKVVKEAGESKQLSFI